MKMLMKIGLPKMRGLDKLLYIEKSDPRTHGNIVKLVFITFI